jgi:DNA-binding response OmpR family regulator
MKTKVMIVDDEPDIVRLVCETLEMNGMEAIKAGTGIECLYMMDKGTIPDVVLLDIMMPEKDGYAVCREIKADVRYRNVIVIALTAKVQNRDKVDSYKAGVDGYISKPFDPDQLIAEIKIFLNDRGNA